jgi:hypothetical protein
MSDWLHSLPIFWMTLVVFGFTYLLEAEIYGLVTTLAKTSCGRGESDPMSALGQKRTFAMQ